MTCPTLAPMKKLIGGNKIFFNTHCHHVKCSASRDKVHLRMSGDAEKINSKKIVEEVIQNVMTQNDDENECKKRMAI